MSVFVALERKTERNQTQCYTGHKSNVLVYKVDSSMKVDPPDTVRIIAVEKQSTAEVEVQVWKTVEGTVSASGNNIKGIVLHFCWMREH